MKVVGFCRFSYPAIGGFKQMHDSVAEREAFLYAQDRMETRFRHFETVTLPSIAAQTDPEFVFLIQIGETLPKEYTDRLHDLVAGIPQALVVAQPPMRHRTAAQAAILAILEGVETDSIQFRLDDDDAIGVNFVEQCRLLARRTERLRRKARHFALEFNRGYTIALSDKGILAEPHIAPFWSCGLAMIARAGEQKTIMNYGHHKLHHSMPMLIQPQEDMFLRSNHDENDSKDSIRKGNLTEVTPELQDHLKARFNLDAAHVRAVFSR